MSIPPSLESAVINAVINFRCGLNETLPSWGYQKLCTVKPTFFYNFRRLELPALHPCEHRLDGKRER